jgi:hypothetical protein
VDTAANVLSLVLELPSLSASVHCSLLAIGVKAGYAPIMKFTEIASRMTGFSSPIFGVSWQPSTPDVTIARRVLAFLEDRQLLYAPYEVEQPEHCIASVLKMRDFLTGLLGDQPMGSDLTDSLRVMRSACRKFMSTVNSPYSRGLLSGVEFPGDEVARHNIFDTETGKRVPYPLPRNYIWKNTIEFNQALGELRGVFGIYIGLLATKYGLDIEDSLASILPESEEDQSSDP